MRQRIKVAQALVHDLKVLVLDEPLTGIDPMGRGDLMTLFKSLGEAGKAVLISTHIIQAIEEITDRIVLMARGRVLAAGTVARIRDLLDDRPLTLRISATRARELAVDLLGREEVAGSNRWRDSLTWLIRRPESFFAPYYRLSRGGGSGSGG
jgi:ABC-2 type transport system ATP-binding protein